MPGGETHYICFLNLNPNNNANYDILASTDLSSSPGTIGSVANEYYVGNTGSKTTAPTNFAVVTGAALSIALEGYPLSHQLWQSLAPGHPVVSSVAFSTTTQSLFSTNIRATPFTLAQDTELTSVVMRYKVWVCGEVVGLRRMCALDVCVGCVR